MGVYDDERDEYYPDKSDRVYIDDDIFEEHFILRFVRSTIAGLYNINIYDIPQERLDEIYE